eukprot:5006549-Prymnesium_polylepis.1
MPSLLVSHEDCSRSFAYVRAGGVSDQFRITNATELRAIVEVASTTPAGSVNLFLGLHPLDVESIAHNTMGQI